MFEFEVQLLCQIGSKIIKLWGLLLGSHLGELVCLSLAVQQISPLTIPFSTSLPPIISSSLPMLSRALKKMQSDRFEGIQWYPKQEEDNWQEEIPFHQQIPAPFHLKNCERCFLGSHRFIC